MLVFLVATSLILSAVVVPDLLTQGRRERETEMVWRGEQYERAIGLYFRKFGRYPTKVDDLTKQTNGVRFLRQAYKDPMNKEDGTWRFIYVGPNGQLIGSVKSQSLLQSAMTGSTPPATLLQGAGPQVSATSGTPAAGGAAAAPGQPGQQTGQQTGQQAGDALASNPLTAQPQPLGSAVIGGNIIGVGSKIKESSLMDYLGGDSYDKWEFIWNPVQAAIPGQGGSVNPAVPGTPGAPVSPGQQQLQNQQATPGIGTQPQQPQTPPNGSSPPVNPTQ